MKHLLNKPGGRPPFPTRTKPLPQEQSLLAGVSNFHLSRTALSLPSLAAARTQLKAGLKWNTMPRESLVSNQSNNNNGTNPKERKESLAGDAVPCKQQFPLLLINAKWRIYLPSSYFIVISNLLVPRELGLPNNWGIIKSTDSVFFSRTGRETSLLPEGTVRIDTLHSA